MLGKLVVFEGGEGAGKTTQLNRVQAWLSSSGWLERIEQNLPPGTPTIMVTREPGGTLLGKTLRKLLLDQTTLGNEPLSQIAELLLYAADRAQHVSHCLRPHLQQGTLVLCDRYTDSTLAYQGYGRGLDLSIIEQLNQIATQGLTSDLTLWLDLEAAAGLARTQERGQDPEVDIDRMEANAIAFHQRVQSGFRTLAEDAPERVIRIDGQQSEEAVAEQIQAVLGQRLQIWYPQLP
ncbi:MAG: dTMP kinase [Acaryochloridaceae cyanobacterium SU_2_1]|nr:dTMP kinase [Acaryochloridaceae cyanobacterium SU_2_1]